MQESKNSGSGSRGEVIDEVDAEKMDLVVLGITKAPSVNRIVGGSTVRSAIENCELPLLLIPGLYKLLGFKSVEWPQILMPANCSGKHQF